MRERTPITKNKSIPEDDDDAKAFRKKAAVYFRQSGSSDVLPGTILISISLCHMKQRPDDVTRILGDFGWRLTKEKNLEKIPEEERLESTIVPPVKKPTFISVDKVPHSQPSSLTKKDSDGGVIGVDRHR